MFYVLSAHFVQTHSIFFLNPTESKSAFILKALFPFHLLGVKQHYKDQVSLIVVVVVFKSF